MSCLRERIEAYMDGELDATEHTAVERHLAECAECSTLYARLREQQAGIRSLGPYATPEPLERNIRAVLLQETAKRAAPNRWRWLAIAAAVLLAISAGWNVMEMRRHAEPDNLIAQDVVSGHIRSLMASHLVDVPSTDRHTVKPWFNGKLDFSPDVKDFAAQGFPLIGGRVDYLDGRNVAALVYRRGQHPINLFTWPAAEAAGDGEYSRNGYNAIHWTSGSMAYWVVSDAGMADLRQLRGLYLAP